jgi:hypothetical protein
LHKAWQKGEVNEKGCNLIKADNIFTKVGSKKKGVRKTKKKKMSFAAA